MKTKTMVIRNKAYVATQVATQGALHDNKDQMFPLTYDQMTPIVRPLNMPVMWNIDVLMRRITTQEKT
jgi:hypothetical protein